MTSLSTKRILDVPPQLVLEVAYGVEDPEQIALRHGFSDSEWLLLKAHAPFIKQVEDKKAELKASGYTFRMKSAFIAEDLLDDLYKKATEEDASFSVLLETIKFTSKAAGLDAPVKTDQAPGAKFSITIDIGGGKSVSVAVNQNNEKVVDVESEDIQFEMADELGAVPGYLADAPELRAE